jgi:hypothetical protein
MRKLMNNSIAKRMARINSRFQDADDCPSVLSTVGLLWASNMLKAKFKKIIAPTHT